MGSCQSWAAEQDAKAAQEREERQANRLHRDLAEAMKSWSFNRLLLVEEVSVISDTDLRKALDYLKMFQDFKAFARMQRALADL